MKILKLITVLISIFLYLNTNSFAQKEYYSHFIEGDSLFLRIDLNNLPTSLATSEFSWNKLRDRKHLIIHLVSQDTNKTLRRCQFACPKNDEVQLIDVISDSQKYTPRQNHFTVEFQQNCWIHFRLSQSPHPSFYCRLKLLPLSTLDQTRDLTIRFLPQERISELKSEHVGNYWWIEIFPDQISNSIKVNEILYTDVDEYRFLKFEIFNFKSFLDDEKEVTCQIEIPENCYYRRAYIEPFHLGKNIKAEQNIIQFTFKKWFSIIYEVRPTGLPVLPIEFVIKYSDPDDSRNSHIYKIRLTKHLTQFIPLQSIQISRNEIDFGVIDEDVSAVPIEVTWTPSPELQNLDIQCSLSAPFNRSLLFRTEFSNQLYDDSLAFTLDDLRNKQTILIIPPYKKSINQDQLEQTLHFKMALTTDLVRFDNDESQRIIPVRVTWQPAFAWRIVHSYMVASLLIVVMISILVVWRRQYKSRILRNQTASIKNENYSVNFSQAPVEKVDLKTAAEEPEIEEKPSPVTQAETLPEPEPAIPEKQSPLESGKSEKQVQQLKAEILSLAKQLKSAKSRTQKLKDQIKYASDRRDQHEQKEQKQIARLKDEIDQLKNIAAAPPPDQTQVNSLEARIEELEESLKAKAQALEAQEKERRQYKKKFAQEKEQQTVQIKELEDALKAKAQKLEAQEKERRQQKEQFAAEKKKQDARMKSLEARVQVNEKVNESSPLAPIYGSNTDTAIEMLTLLVQLTNTMNDARLESDAGPSIRFMTRKLAGMLAQLEDTENDPKATVAKAYSRLKENHLQKVVNFIDSLGRDYRPFSVKLKKFL